MTGLDLAAIEAWRDAAYADGSWVEPEWDAIITLLAEVKDLRAKVEAAHDLADKWEHDAWHLDARLPVPPAVEQLREALGSPS